MRLLTAILLITLVRSTASAQSDSTLLTNLKALQKSEQYDKIISEYAPKSSGYDKRALMVIGNAYYHKGDDENCIKYMDRVLALDSMRNAAWYYRGSSQNYLGKYDDAIASFSRGVKIDSNDGQCWWAMGESYYNLKKYDLALEAYKHATRCPEPPDEAYTKIAAIYSDLNQDNLMLTAYYDAKAHIAKTSKAYTNLLFNIGLQESLLGNFQRAEPVFLELVQLSPDDYPTYAKLVQAYHGLHEYEKAKPWRAKLYEAHSKGLLTDNLADMFCFDQFLWKGNRVKAFERFQDDTNDVYPKHKFYVTNKDGKIAPYVVQTEFDPVLVELKEGKYILCKQEGRTHGTYLFKFEDKNGEIDYDKLKADVLLVLDGKIEPGASSTTKSSTTK